MKLASYIRPFDVNQKIYVLNDRFETEELRLVKLEDFPNAVMELINIYNVNELELHGNENFCAKLQRDIQKEELDKYNKNNLKILLKGVE